MKVCDLVKMLNLTVFCGEEGLDTEITGGYTLSLIHIQMCIRDRLDLSTQFHEGLGKESELYKKYDLRKGFKNFLINDEGVIIAANVTPEKLTEILKAI